jgi:glycosyl-4,4'-diaponeurosporenoate acyltransferase
VSVRVIDLSNSGTVLLDCVVWAVVSVAVGYTARRSSDDHFARDGWLLRARPFERDGQFYEDRLRIKAWKGHLPEAGHWFADGFDKKHLRRGSAGHLEQFVVETRRAEWTHWTLMIAGPVFLLWNPWWLGLVMIAYAVIANGPCIAIQRYNRCRLARVLARAHRRSAPRRDDASAPRSGSIRAPDPPRQVGDGHSRSGVWAVGRTNPEHPRT